VNAEVSERTTTVWDMVLAAAATRPEAIALTDGRRDMTYGDLISGVRRVTRSLRRRGARPGTVVALCAGRSVAQVVTALAVLATGAAIAPFDVRHAPIATRERVSRLRPAVSVADADGAAVLPGAVTFDELAAGPPPDGDDQEEAGELAYVLHTSGSLGMPKPVLVPHAAVTNRFRWGQTCYPLTASDTVVYWGSLVFDCTFWVVFAPLCFGATLLVAPDGVEAEPAELAELLVRHRVTVMHFVPSLLREFLAGGGASGLAQLRYLLIAGERLTGPLVGEVFAASPARVFNQYGPTEACIDILTCELRPEDARLDAVPIGRPIAGVHAYVVGPDDRLAPDGEPGELHVGGVCLAWGYGRAGGATAAAFRPDDLSGERDGRLYRTGDLVRRRSDGVLEFLGRVDHQVKIRGVRIEPSDVEHVLLTHPDVAQAAVVAVSGDQDLQLVAHLVCAATTPEPAHLRAFLAERVPAAAVPAAFLRHSALPRVTSGKLDRLELTRRWELALRAMADEPSAGADEPPRTGTEREVARLWGEMFGVPNLGRADDFLRLGGESLLAMRMVARVQATFGVRLSARTVFEAPTVHGFAAALDAAIRERDSTRGSGSPAVPASCSQKPGPGTPPWRRASTRNPSEKR